LSDTIFAAYYSRVNVKLADNVDAADFKEIPWCVKLIEDPAYYSTPTLSRQPKPSIPLRGGSPFARSQTFKDPQFKKFAC